MQGRTRLARAIRQVGEKQIGHHVRKPDKALVLTADPLRVELVGSRVNLDDEEILLAHGVRKYDQEHGLKPGDVLLVVPTHSEDWIATNVVPQGDQNNMEGVQPELLPASQNLGGTPTTVGTTGTPTNGWQTAPTLGTLGTPGTNVVGKLAVRDDKGDVIGYIPVYATIS
jgi:hypothetical protein